MAIDSDPMRIGVIVPMSQGDGPGRMPSWGDTRAFAGHADDIRLDSVWVFDHFFYRPPEGSPEGTHEAWTIVGALAASTARVEIGQLVMCATFRHPGLLAKMAVTADVVSEGRILLGLGAGWHDPEYVAFGYPTDHRVDRFEEALRIIGPLLRGERVSFEGRYHQAHDAELLPAPHRRIPILIAAKGPRMLRLTARHADAWNTAWFGAPDERLRQRLADLERALDDEGRDPQTLRRTVGLEIHDPDFTAPEQAGIALRGATDHLARMLDAHQALGFDDAVVVLQPMNERSLDRLAEAIRLRTG
jgi:alkanesulfonate monooxygenase SsuD/methylene tetrahydromethanopterin reductase-like flavin-dependent oxidoreductase (luciferase family)